MRFVLAALFLVASGMGFTGAQTQTSTVPVTGYLPCPVENGYCGFTGVSAVAFGGGTPAGLSFQYRFATNGVQCSNSFFGDPLPGVLKSCYQRPLTPCATEGGVCSFSGSSIVVYGAGSSFKTGVYTGGVQCGNGVFGDPDVGIGKACYLFK